MRSIDRCDHWDEFEDEPRESELQFMFELAEGLAIAAIFFLIAFPVRLHDDFHKWIRMLKS